MPQKGMLGLFSHSHHHSRPFPDLPSPSRPSSDPPSPSPQTFSATLMEENISTAESIINKRDPSYYSSSSSSSGGATLFSGDRAEARHFLRAVGDLQNAMLFFISDHSSAGESRANNLARAQSLMQSAMRILQKEFHQILSANRDFIDFETVSSSARSSASDAGSAGSGSADDDEIGAAGDSIGEVERASAVAMADLRSIAQTMVCAGYGRECIKIYQVIRKSIVDESLYHLGFEKLTSSQIQKLDWPVLELKIQSWMAASVVAVKTLFSGEQILCDHVFDGIDTIRESVFADITRDAAVQFLRFPESVAKSKRSPEKLFRFLDLYDAISDLWSEIESVFSFESTTAVRSQALASLLKLSEAARGTLAEFEAAIQKDASKSPVPGGGIHPLTRYVMNYIVLLADYDAALADIYAGFPLQIPSPLPEHFFFSSAISAPSSPSNSPSFDATTPRSSISDRIAWLVLVLLCKLDGKVEKYREVSLSYLFLANNLQYIVNKVKESRLKFVLGDEWVAKNAAKARHYAESYERLAWAKVAAAIPADPAAEMAAMAAWERMMGFNTAFEEAFRVQREWTVADEKMREDVRASVAGLIVPAYRAFYEMCRTVLKDSGVLRFAPEAVRSRVAELFSGSTGSGAVSVSRSNKSWWRSAR